MLELVGSELVKRAAERAKRKENGLRRRRKGASRKKKTRSNRGQVPTCPLRYSESSYGRTHHRRPAKPRMTFSTSIRGTGKKGFVNSSCSTGT